MNKHVQADSVGQRSEEEQRRYTRRSILRSEELYGPDFQSPGGRAAVDAICQEVPMSQGVAILDLGSGLGGAAFYFAERFRAKVVGIDASPDMIEMSRERCAKRGLSTIEFRLDDVRTAPLEQAAFDMVWSRDAMLYLAEKELIWRRACDATKPDGYLVVTDFCCGVGSLTDEFQQYTDEHGYHLQSIDEYASLIRDAGWSIEVSRDMTGRFIELLQQERDSLSKNRDAFSREYGEDDYLFMLRRWEKKLPKLQTIFLIRPHPPPPDFCVA